MPPKDMLTHFQEFHMLFPKVKDSIYALLKEIMNFISHYSSFLFIKEKQKMAANWRRHLS
jgi:hypothetical protein